MLAVHGRECFSEKYWISSPIPGSSIPQGEGPLQRQVENLCGSQVREETAEYLYLILQTNDVSGTEEAEPFLLETDW
jgi:hypothetical protein